MTITNGLRSIPRRSLGVFLITALASAVFTFIVFSPQRVAAQGATAPPLASCSAPVFDAQLDANDDGSITEAERAAAPLFVNGINVRTGIAHISVAVDLAPGGFVVDEAIAWDGYPDRASTEVQADERFAVQFLLGGVVVATSAFTGSGGTDGDGIDTGVISDFWVGPLGEVNLPGGADELRLIHSVPSIASGANSVSPSSICVSEALGSIGDTVWQDLNSDGIQDSGEPGVPDVTVNLLDMGGNVLATTTTDGSGKYLFDNLPATDYGVEFVAPDGAEFTLQDVGDDTLDSDADPTTGRVGVVTLGASENRTDVDAGLVIVPLGSLGDRVWFDDNGDGLQDPGEVGINGVTVRLLDAGGVELDSTVTAGDGDYLFPDLVDGTYIVEFVLIGGAFTDANAGGDDAIDSDADPATGRSHLVDLGIGENDPTIDAGVVALTPNVDIEKDTNGEDADAPTGPTVEVGADVTWTYVITNSGDYDLAGVVVTDDQGVLPVRDDSTDVGSDDILSIGESWTYTATGTAVGGQYANLGSVSGDPVVDGQPATDPFGDPVGPVDDDDPSHYLGFVPGEAGIDIEKSTNGADADSADPAINPIPEIFAGAAVTWTYDVTNTSDAIWLTDIVVTDDILGEICVIDGPLAPFDTAQCEFVGTATLGDYENLGSVIGTPSDEDGNRATNPDGSEIPEPTDEDPSHYVGVEPPAALGDRVWLDVNGDGIQDDDEVGIEGITVNLTDAECTIISTTTTDANGNYLFTDLPAGDYRIQVIVPGGHVISPPDQGGDDAADSDIDDEGKTDVVTLAQGESNLTLDAGLVPLSSIGDIVWRDLDDDGIHDDDEPGVAGVTVNLLDSDENVIATTTTDGSGLYLFDNLAADTYIVEFIEPERLTFTLQAEGDNRELDSDADPATGRTDPVELGIDEHRLDIDAGLTGLNAVGNIAWFDANTNGLQDPGEAPVEGLVLEIVTPGPNGVLDGSSEPPRVYVPGEKVADDGTRTAPVDLEPVVASGSASGVGAASFGDDVVRATTTTDAEGFYAFGELPIGNYLVCVRLDSIPANLMLTEQNVRGNRADALDNDVDPDSGCTFPLAFMTGNADMTLDIGLMTAAQVLPKPQTPVKGLAVTGLESGREAILAASLLLIGMGLMLLAVDRRRSEFLSQ